jgi:hypothetical protein
MRYTAPLVSRIVPALRIDIFFMVFLLSAPGDLHSLGVTIRKHDVTMWRVDGAVVEP